VFVGTHTISAQTSDCEDKKDMKEKTAEFEDKDLGEYLSNKTWETSKITQFNSANPEGVSRSSGLKQAGLYFTYSFAPGGHLKIKGNSPDKGKFEKWEVKDENVLLLSKKADKKPFEYIISERTEKSFVAKRKNPITKQKELITFSYLDDFECDPVSLDEKKNSVILTGTLGKNAFGSPTVTMIFENNSDSEITGFQYKRTLLDEEGNVIESVKGQYHKMFISTFKPKPSGESGGIEPGYKGKAPEMSINGLTDEEKKKIAKVKLEFLRTF